MSNLSNEILIQAVISIIIAVLFIGFIITILLLNKKRALLQKKELEAIKTAFEKDLIQTRLEIQEDVLRNISQEIHDNIGQVMLLANVNTTILQSMHMPTGAPELIKETKNLISKAIEDISQLSRSLHSDRITEIGVFTAIKYELNLLKEKGLYQVSFEDNSSLEEKLLPKETQLVIFRMYQEISKNIIKHARADSIHFSITDLDGGVELTIADNGIGFDTKVDNVFNGVGMRSLQSRIKLIRGSLSITSLLQKGTRIGIFIPINQIEFA